MPASPIFPGRYQPSILGDRELNYRVRNGNGWNLKAIDTGKIYGKRSDYGAGYPFVGNSEFRIGSAFLILNSEFRLRQETLVTRMRIELMLPA